MALTDTGKAWFDDWLTGDDPTVGFVNKITRADASVRYTQLFRSPGYRKITGNEYAFPGMAFTEPLSISILNESIGQRDEDTGRVMWEQFRVGQLQGGGFEVFLHESDPDLLAWAEDAWADADGVFYIGTLSTDWADFEAFYSYKVAAEPTWRMGGTGAHALQFRTKSAVLNLNLQAQTTRFAGTGGAEGTANLEGLPKPRGWGRVKHIRPPLVVPADERYYVSTEAIEDVEEVYEKGHPNGSGLYTETLASGYFELNNTAEFEPVTCDTKLEKIDSGSWTDDAGKILEYMLDDFWGGSVNSASVAAYSTDFTAGIGVWLDPQQTRTRHKTLDFGLAPLGTCFPTQSGDEFKIQVVEKPEDQSASLAYDESHIRYVEAGELSPAVYRVLVGYQERYAQDDPLPEDSADREYLQKARSFAKAEDLTVQADYPNAIELEVHTAIYSEADAASVAADLLALLKVPRRPYRVGLAQQALHSWVGDYVSIEHPDYPEISTATNVLVAGFGAIDLANKTVEMLCWGGGA